MSFRPFNSNSWRAATAGLACLAFAGTARAQDGRSIEVVPFHNSSIGTNFEQLPQDDSHSFKIWEPTAPNSTRPTSPQMATPLPHPQQSLSKEEQQILDRRRNWVFMRAEDYAKMDPKTGKSLLGDDHAEDDNMTAMERFYHRLEQSGKSSTTNGFSQLIPDRDHSKAATDSFGSALPNTDAGPFGATPFNAAQQAGIFQPMARGDSANVFGNNNSDVPMQTPEEARQQAEQKAHMEDFKQLWNIDQASSAVTPAAAPASVPIDSAPLFGASTPGLAPGFKASLAPDLSGSSSAKTPTPTPQPIVSPRVTAPPHSDFMPTPRAF